MVDAHNIVPVWVASDKVETGARTIRPKIVRNLPEYLEEFPEVESHTFNTEKVLSSVIIHGYCGQGCHYLLFLNDLTMLKIIAHQKIY